MQERRDFIIVIEDDPISGQILKKILLKRGYEIEVYEDGEKGWQRILTRKPDLLLLDIILPGIDGFEIIKRIKENSKIKNTPVIFISSLEDTPNQIKGFKCGAVDYISKPFKPEELIARVNTHIEIQHTKESLELQSEMLKASIEIINNQSQELKGALEKVKDSINYARLIQMALFPDQKQIKKVFNDFFLYFKPLEQLSGDFYWVKEIGDKVYFGVGDCTGHSVPGALLSIISLGQLNEIVSRLHKSTPDQILNILRYRMKLLLSNNSSGESLNDGLAISLCVLDKKTRVLQFSGAYHPLMYISKQNGDFIVGKFKGDKMPVSQYPHEKPFTMREMQLSKGDKLYSFSDGITDQFSELESRKFSGKKMEEIIQGLLRKPFCEHKQIIVDKWESWKGNASQTDDVILLGVEIK